MQAVVAELLPLVPLQRREKALRYKHLHGQYCCLRAWKMLHELLIEHAYLPAPFPLADLTYTENEYGKPSLNVQISNLKSQISNIEFSLSHTKCAIAVAIDRQPVGIDVEAVVSPQRIADRHFLEHTMNAAERQMIAEAADPCLMFTELWTRKEALVKARGTGLDLATLPDMLASQLSACHLSTIHTSAYACSIARM